MEKMTDGGMTTAEVLAGSTTLRETAMMLDEMRSVYSGSDESARMTSIIARREQLNLEAKKREESCKDLILQLQSGLNDAKAEANRKVPKEVAKAELEGALAQLAMAKENVQQMEAQSRYLEQKHEELQIEAAGLAKRREELEELATEQYPRAVNARSLFAHISKITWSDEGRGGHKSNSASLGHPGTVEGTICNPEKGDIRKFCLSVAEDGGVFGVTNRLWELMDA